MTLQASGIYDRFLLSTCSGAAFGFHPYNVGLKWNGTNWVTDVETIFAGPINDSVGVDTPSATLEEEIVVVLDEFYMVNSSGQNRIRIRWFPVDQQVLEGYYYGLASSPIDVVEFKSVSSSVGMVFSEGVVTTHNSIVIGGDYHIYPFPS